jgi:hypothetical protein
VPLPATSFAEEAQMSTDPESNGSVALENRIGEVEPEPPEPAALVSTPAPVEPSPVEPIGPTPRRSARWVLPVAVAAVGLIASGSLGYLLYTTTGQRDTARHQLASTQATLATTKTDLSAALSDAAAKKVTADYASLFVANDGAVQTGYQNVILCNNYSSCRTSAQQLLTDLQAFQAARSSGQVPAALSSADGMLRDALSAAIAGTQEFITGMDNGDAAKIKDGGSKVDAAMLSVAKAQAALGTGLR